MLAAASERPLSTHRLALPTEHLSPSLKKASEMTVWAGQLCCGLTMPQGHLRGPDCHQRRERNQVPLPAIRKLNSEPTPGSFGAVLQNPGTCLLSARVCFFPEKSSGARGGAYSNGVRGAGRRRGREKTTAGTRASPGGKGLPWGRYHTASWDSGVTGVPKARCSHHPPRPAAAFLRCSLGPQKDF